MLKLVLPTSFFYTLLHVILYFLQECQQDSCAMLIDILGRLYKLVIKELHEMINSILQCCKGKRNSYGGRCAHNEKRIFSKIKMKSK